MPMENDVDEIGYCCTHCNQSFISAHPMMSFFLFVFGMIISIQAVILTFGVLSITRLESSSTKRDVQIDSSINTQKMLLDGQLDIKDLLRSPKTLL